MKLKEFMSHFDFYARHDKVTGTTHCVPFDENSDIIIETPDGLMCRVTAIIVGQVHGEVKVITEYL